jgi:drug/metabolite transporter (DMT)-like permease
MEHKKIIPKLALLIVAITWGSSFAFQEHLVEEMGPALFTFYNFLGAFLLFFLYSLYKGYSFSYRYEEGVGLGILLGTMELTQMYGLDLSSAANTAFISNVGMLFVPFIGWLLFRHRLKAMHIVTLFVAGVGMYYLVGGVDGFGIGDGILLISAMCMALYFVYSERFEGMPKSNMSVLCTQQFFVVIVFMGVVLFSTDQSLAMNHSSIPSLLWQMLVFTIVPYGLIQWASKYSDEMTVAMYDGVVEPLSGGVVAWGLFRNPVTLVNMIGAFLMLVAFAWSVLIEHKKHFVYTKTKRG